MSGRLKKRLLPIALLLLLISIYISIPQSTTGQQSNANLSTADLAPAELARRTKAIFQQSCFRCHGQNGNAAKGIFVLDRPRLLASRAVIPGETDSLLIKAIESGAMPLGGPELSETEKDVLRRWVLSGAPDWSSANASNTGIAAEPSRNFLAEPELLESVRRDLEQAPSRERPYLRYFSLTHLYNSGVSAEELERYRTGLAKLINSLSWHREITLPAPINPGRTLFRIDLRDYLWTAATWRRILANYPYGLISPEVESIARLSGEIVPYVRADWFVAQASVPPLYHDILGLPLTISELERRLGVNTSRNLAEEKNVIRAGVRSSGVSQNNRVLERHISPFGAYWRSYDFKSNLGDQNIFADPLRLRPSGGEIIFNLPNGLQAYFLADALGGRIDAAPVEIVADRNQPDDPVIRNGRSCMGCHYAGMKTFQDDLRPAIQKMTFASFDINRALALYVAQVDLSRVLSEDETRFRRAEERLSGGPSGGQLSNNASGEPVNALSRRYGSELSLAQASAEAGLEPRDFQERIRWSSRLASFGLGQLLTANGGFKRDAWEKHFGDVVRELQLGVYQSGEQIIAGMSLIREGANPVAVIGMNRQLRSATQSRLQSNPDFALNGSKDSLRSAQTVFIRTRTVYLQPETLENALRKRADFNSLELTIVKESKIADLVIELNRPLFTFDFTFSVIHRPSSALLASGKVVAFDGKAAAPRIAAELIKQFQMTRVAR